MTDDPYDVFIGEEERDKSPFLFGDLAGDEEIFQFDGVIHAEGKEPVARTKSSDRDIPDLFPVEKGNIVILQLSSGCTFLCTDVQSDIERFQDIFTGRDLNLIRCGYA